MNPVLSFKSPSSRRSQCPSWSKMKEVSVLGAFDSLCQSFVDKTHRPRSDQRTSSRVQIPTDLDLDLELDHGHGIHLNSSLCSVTSLASSLASCQTVRPGVSLHNVLQALRSDTSSLSSAWSNEGDNAAPSSCASISSISEEDERESTYAELSMDDPSSITSHEDTLKDGVFKKNEEVCSRPCKTVSSSHSVSSVDNANNARILSSHSYKSDEEDSTADVRDNSKTPVSLRHLRKHPKLLQPVVMLKELNVSKELDTTKDTSIIAKRSSKDYESKNKRSKKLNVSQELDTTEDTPIVAKRSSKRIIKNKKALDLESPERKTIHGRNEYESKNNRPKRHSSTKLKLENSNVDNDKDLNKRKNTDKTTKSEAKPLKKSAMSRDTKEHIVLWDWIIKPVHDYRGVCVEGQREGQSDFWHSTAIKRRVKHNLVITASGSQYYLKGKINKLCTLDCGFTEEVVRAFSKGFPSNWEKVVADFYRKIEDSVMEVLPWENKKQPWRARGKKSLPDHPLGSVSILTAAGMMKRENGPHEVIVTRSGRRSLPPLAAWAGQHYSVDPDTNAVKVQFQTEFAENVHNKQTKDILNRTNLIMTKDIKAAVFHKSLSSSPLLCRRTQNKKVAKSTTEQVVVNLVSTDTNAEKQSNNVMEICTPNTGDDVNKENDLYVPNTQTVQSSEMKKNSSQYTLLMDSEKQLTTNHHGQNREPPNKKQKNENKTCDDYRLRNKNEQKSSHAKKTSTVGKNDVSLSTRKSAKKPEIQRKKCSIDDLDKNSSSDTGEKNPTNNNRSSKLNNAPNMNAKTALKNTNSQKKRDSSIKTTPSKMALNRENKESDSTSKTLSRKEKPTQEIGTKHDTLCRAPRPRRAATRATELCQQIFSVDQSTEKSKSRNTKSRGKHNSFYAEESSSNAIKSRSSKGHKKASNRASQKRGICDVEGLDTVENDRPKVKSRKVDGGRGEGDWTKEETSAFYRALREIGNCSSDYWAEVAEMVGSRSEEECQQFHLQSLEAKSKNRTTGKAKKADKPKGKNARQKGEPIRGKRGTLKRKQDIRDFLNEQNEGYIDNMFDGTPFVNKKKTTSVAHIDFDKNHSDIFGANHNFFTPCTKQGDMSTPGTRLKAVMASAMATPAARDNSANETPVSFTRHAADRFMRDFFNKKKLPVATSFKANEQQTDLSLTKEDAGLPVKALFSPILNPGFLTQQGTLRSPGVDDDEEDEDNPYMYYWDDN